MTGSNNGSGAGRRPRKGRERGLGSAVTLIDIARHAGVSLATASRVLNGSARTPAEPIAERVRTSARELGYVANAQTQALARSATGLVGLVVHDIADPYFSSITRGAQRYAGGQRSQVLLAGAERNESAELEAVAAFASYRTTPSSWRDRGEPTTTTSWPPNSSATLPTAAGWSPSGGRTFRALYTWISGTGRERRIWCGR